MPGLSARAPGQGGAFYTTALSIANRGAAEARYKMKFLGNNADGTAGQESEEFVLGPNQSVTYEDVLGSVFGRTTDFGAIRVTANVTTLSVLGQTSTPVLTSWASCVATGSFGQSVPAFAPADLVSAGSPKVIVGVREDATFRTNLILAELAGEKARVKVVLRKTGGASLGEPLLVDLGPNERKQINQIILELSLIHI